MNIGNEIINRIDSFKSNKNGNSLPNKEKKAEHLFDEKQLPEIVQKLNNEVNPHLEGVSFSYHEKTKRIIVKIINKETNEIVREFPSKDAIKMLEHLREYLGVFIDESR